MKHNAKRVLSMALCVLMCLSMLTAFVLPAAVAAPADPYAMVTGTTVGNVIIPDANVYFINPAWASTAPAATGETFDYTYGDGNSWGNGKTYRLTWGTNTGKSITDIKTLSKAHNSAWAANTASKSQDMIFVCAPGTYGYVNEYDFLTAGGVTVPTQDQLSNFYLLGPQAGKSAVNPNKATMAEAKKVMNGRSDSTATEAVFNNTFWVPGHCYMYMDGFACNTACRLYAAYSYVTYDLHNLYFVNQTTPAAHSIFGLGGGSRPTMVEMHDCYFNMNTQMTRADLTGEENSIIANKIIIDNCVFAEGKLSVSAPKANYQTHHIKLYPNTAATGTACAAFFGEYATKPVIQITNCVGVNWESAHLFRFPFNSGNYAGYNDNIIQIDISNNKFWDVGLVNSGSDVFYFDKITKGDQADAFTMNMSGNLFSFSDENFLYAKKGGSTNVMTFNAPFLYNDDDGNGKRESTETTNIASKYKITIKENVFALAQGNSAFRNHDNNIMPAIDLSGNLFMNNQGEIMPMTIDNASPPGYTNGWNVQSDIYASDEMKGGVRELMTAVDVENGAALYAYVSLRNRGNLYKNYRWIRGALTVMLKNGVTYDANSLIKFKDPDVEFLGIYTEEACTTKVDTVTQDTINGKWAKARYVAGNTTLTVVYKLNTPRNYLFVDPTGTHKTGYSFNGKVYKDGEKTDGVYAKFYTFFDSGNNSAEAKAASAYAAVTNPNCNDQLAIATQSYTDKDGASYNYDNNMWDVIIFCPGTHTFTNVGNTTNTQGMGKSVAILGPQWGVSPYGEANKMGAPANNRSFDPAKEAVVKGTFAPSGDASLSYVVDGLAFAGGNVAYNMNGASKLLGSLFQNHAIRNCVFSNDVTSVIAGANTATSNKVMSVVVSDCIYDGTGLDRSEKNGALLNYRANFATIENVAVMNENSKNDRLAYVTVTDGSKVRWTAKRTYVDFHNVINYNTNRDGVLYTLRESDNTTVNATKEYYTNGLEMSVLNTYTVGGSGYLWGIQGNEKTDDLVKLTASGNYYYRPDWDNNVIAHYQKTNTKLDVYTDDSVAEGNVFITKNLFKANAYGSDLNIDNNFFGKVVDNAVVMTFVDPNAKGVVKDPSCYWLDEPMTVRNIDMGLEDVGYMEMVAGAYDGANHYTIETMKLDNMFAAAEGAVIEGVYTDETCTTAVTEFTHDQDVVVKVAKNGVTMLSTVALTMHEWDDEYTFDVPATCQQDGYKSIHCVGCDLKQEGTEVFVPMGEHVWSDTYTADVEATCMLGGMESIHCSICDIVKPGSARELPIAGHDWSDEYWTDKMPTCTEKGSKSYHCNVCYISNEESAVEIPVTEHNWQSWTTVDVEPTCTKDGQSFYHCHDCDAVKAAEIIPAAHMDVIRTYIVIPTYQEGGIEGDICTVCGTVLEQWAVEAAEGEMADTVFEDVDSDDWFYKNDAVNFVYNEGLMNGVTKTTFAPNATLTRGMFVTILGRLVGVDENGSGKTAFKDVDENAYYAPYIKWAAEEGIVNGYSATEFRPDGNITREQICKMILEFCNAEGITIEQTAKAIAFKDAAEISSWAKLYVTACQRAGLVNGEKSGSGYIFRPQDTASRAEAATIIRNFCYAYLIG